MRREDHQAWTWCWLSRYCVPDGWREHTVASKTPSRRGGGGRARTWIRRTVGIGLVSGLALETLQLRRRLAGLRTLPERPEPEPYPLRLLTAENVRVDPVTLGSARAYAQQRRLVVLDLVPGDLPTAQALDLLRTVDPATYRTDRMARGWSALHAALADEGVLRAAGVSPERLNPNPPELAEAMAQLKLHAPATTDLVVAARLTSEPDVLAEDDAVIAALHGSNATGSLLPRLAWLCALAAGSLVSPRWALAALGAWSAQPLVVFAGSRTLCPADRWSYCASRIGKEPRRLFTALGAGGPATPGRPDPVEQRRPLYQAELAEGIERFFEPRRTDCPWCFSTRITVRLRTRDLFQGKPGSFILDRCRDCGHIFQNPRLSPGGLGFYYRDFYDGLGERELDAKFQARGPMYQSRAAALKGLAQPKAWLDVGTGHGHFCNAARDLWPQTAFDGLDMGEGIKLAEHRGWINRGYRGSFVDLAELMTSSYDVVSMYHYLEHTREPQQELQAARTVLRPGGHLVIDVPDPESAWGRLLGKWWLPWLQPQHQHFISAANLRRRLEQLDFTVLLEQRAEAHTSLDLAAATWLPLHNLLAGGEDRPWRQTRPQPAQRLGRTAAIVAATPVLLVAQITDRLLMPLATHLGLTNAYRMLARKN